MKDTPFFHQTGLLLKVLSHLERKGVFALKGGTAINLFFRAIPRLSVDIDLVYLPLSPRKEALAGISNSLQDLAERLRTVLGVQVEERKLREEGSTIRLLVRDRSVTVKVEPNLVLRGALFNPVESRLHPKAEEMFGLSVSAPLASFPDLYGGKICAALDRQHPRDFFDVRFLLDNEGITDEIRRAFVVYLASHDRPIRELLQPQWKDMKVIFKSEFNGMTLEPVDYQRLVETREELLRAIHDGLKQEERRFLLSLKEGEPEWGLMGFKGIENFPALKWKLENIRKMTPSSRKKQAVLLREVLGI